MKRRKKKSLSVSRKFLLPTFLQPHPSPASGPLHLPFLFPRICFTQLFVTHCLTFFKSLLMAIFSKGPSLATLYRI